MYISSMSKASEEFNSAIVIKHIGCLCAEKLKEAPYWETINNYLKEAKPEELQNTVCELAGSLIRARAFEGGRIRDRFWRILRNCARR